MPMRYVWSTVQHHPKVAALIYLLVLPALIVYLAVVAEVNSRQNGRLDRAQRALIARIDRETDLNCRRSEAIAVFSTVEVGIVFEFDPKAGVRMQKPLEKLLLLLTKLGNCPGKP